MRTSKTGFLLLMFLALEMLSTASAQSTVGDVTLTTAKITRTAIIGGGKSASSSSIATPFVKPRLGVAEARKSSMSLPAASTATALAATLSVPAPKPNTVAIHQGMAGFPGLTVADSTNANGAFQGSPPDQGLCVGHSFVMELINSAMAVYSTAGARLTTPESVNAFFGADLATTFLSDPRCYYDSQTQRWFVSILNVYDANNNYRSNLFLAVSQTSDPRGAFTVYSIDTTDDGLNGTPPDPGCTTISPCYGDQPTLGADAFGIYLTTNEFGTFSSTFNGAQIYALSKADLVAGTPFALVHIGNLPLAEGTAYSVQPASSPELSGEVGLGIEYFLSALDFTSTLDNRIAVWALVNTRSLARPNPKVVLTNAVIHSETYGFPPSASQKVGPYPLGQSLGDPEESLTPDDDRMQQVIFSRGHIWGALSTVVSDGSNLNAGIAYFDVVPNWPGLRLTPGIHGQSYVSVNGASVLYPAVAVTADGAAAAAFTLTGTAYFPSAAYVPLTPTHSGAVNIAASGAAPADDFTAYPQFGPLGTGVARWGDYSWAVADGGTLWLATEYIPGGIDSVSNLTNFGTFIYNVSPQ